MAMAKTAFVHMLHVIFLIFFILNFYLFQFIKYGIEQFPYIASVISTTDIPLIDRNENRHISYGDRKESLF